jgi:hypothetical protein
VDSWVTDFLAAPMTTTGLPRLEPLQSMRAGVQEVAYYQAGPADGDPVVLLHDFLYDIHSYEGVISRLADRHEHGYMVEHVLELLATS